MRINGTTTDFTAGYIEVPCFTVTSQYTTPTKGEIGLFEA